MNILFMFKLNLQQSLQLVLKKLVKLRNKHWFIIDIFTFLFTPLLALLVRHDGNLALEIYKHEIVYTVILFLIVKITILWFCGFYRRYWRYASIEELVYIGMLAIAAIAIQTLLFDTMSYVPNFTTYQLPKSLPLIDGLLSFITIGGLRFSVRAFEGIYHKQTESQARENVLVVGAGSAGVSLVKEMQRNPQLGFNPVAFIDDDPHKLNLRILGIPVIGGRFQIPEISKSLKVDKVIIAMPMVTGRVIREILKICKSNRIKTSTIPGIHELLNNRVRLDSIRSVRIEDLLRREPIQTDIEQVFELIQGRKVLITGAGGSIGSELCRQIYKCQPAEIILLGHGENSVFSIQQELHRASQISQKDNLQQGTIPNIVTLIADLRSIDRLQYTFEIFQPEIVFHAAAHKHVPLMELNSPEAVTNNVIGTKNLLDMALVYDVKHFVMISTDKAVNPTNVMGASKRVAEMLVLRAAQKSRKAFSVVRFGNVLGSRGSVVPTFRKQIIAGGPVTITHPDICRYFMTIPEAVQLVLQAAVLGRGSEIFMLDMGQPVKIVDLAKDLICLSGYEVGGDIDIVFTGLRPGEKLFEELFIPGEEYQKTKHEKILIVQNASNFVVGNIERKLEAISQAAYGNDSKSIIFLLEQLVPEYKPRYPKNKDLKQTSADKYTNFKYLQSQRFKSQKFIRNNTRSS
ncbi:polysaccharide biosynthesis protein [Mastigocoleus testarum]|uniref:polysaccharide biosynthesis protein n=1 Tax=Mastigocoleus testarum TaxID=996925 RepID=UPI0009E9D6DF|nr:nucleoside-diphosphate sugar epimerase/dehydratase [Mastigocoleus testarum]